jgi:hypothetical protein
MRRLTAATAVEALALWPRWLGWPRGTRRAANATREHLSQVLAEIRGPPHVSQQTPRGQCQARPGRNEGTRRVKTLDTHSWVVSEPQILM